MGFTVDNGSEKGSQKGFLEKGSRGSRTCLECPLGEWDSLGVRPTDSLEHGHQRL